MGDGAFPIPGDNCHPWAIVRISTDRGLRVPRLPKQIMDRACMYAGSWRRIRSAMT